MRLAVVLGFLAGLGCVGFFASVRVKRPSLEMVAAAMDRPVSANVDGLRQQTGMAVQAGRSVVGWIDASSLSSHPTWRAIHPALAISGESLDVLAAKVLIGGGAGVLGPLLLWVGMELMGFTVSPIATVLLAVVAGPVGASLPVFDLMSRARDRRRHFRFVIGSFVDLVVLSLAGGVGIEGALFAASTVTNDWASSRMAKSLSRARDGGEAPWSGLSHLGLEIGVPELVELSATLELAGTEGARVRQSLSARASALRRHEQADAESSANAMTERLFLPGALLLFGFLLFLGYPIIHLNV
jgi:hypothetical protein